MMLSYLNVAIVKIPFRSRVMGFSSNRLLSVLSHSHGKEDFRLATVVLGSPTLHHEQTISGEEMHTLIRPLQLDY